MDRGRLARRTSYDTMHGMEYAMAKLCKWCTAATAAGWASSCIIMAVRVVVRLVGIDICCEACMHML